VLTCQTRQEKSKSKVQDSNLPTANATIMSTMRTRRRKITPSVSSLALLGAAVAALAPLTLVESLERAAIPGGGTSSNSCTCHPCDCRPTSRARASARVVSRGSPRRSHPVGVASGGSDGGLATATASGGGNRMRHQTLADQYERIVARCSSPRCDDSDERTSYNRWRRQELLERRLLGTAVLDAHGDDELVSNSNTSDEMQSREAPAHAIRVEVSAVYDDHVENAGGASTSSTTPNADTDTDTEVQAVTSAAVPTGTRKRRMKSQQVSEYNPLRRLSLPYIDDGQLPLIATGTALAISAIALSIYLSGGLATSATAAAVLSSCTPTTAVDKFHWFFRGGGAAKSQFSVGLGPIQLANYVTTRAIPSAFRILKKMAIMEAWRRVWILTFHQMSQLARKASRGTVSIYHRFTPLFIQRGLQSMFKSTVQKAVHGSVTSWLGMAASGASDFVAGMLSTQMEAVVQEAGAVVQEAVEDVVEMACGSVIEAAIDSVGSSD